MARSSFIKVLACIWGMGLLADTKPPVYAQRDVLEPTCYTLDDLLTVTNNGKDIGWFEVGRKFGPYEQLGSFLALENVEKPEKRIYMWSQWNPIGQVFRGTNKIACYLCTGSGAKDPNFGLACENKIDTNTCATCVTRVPCKEVLSMIKCHGAGGEARAGTPLNQLPENNPESIRKKLDLVKPAQ